MSGNLNQAPAQSFVQNPAHFGYSESFGVSIMTPQQAPQQSSTYWSHSQAQFTGNQFPSTYGDCSVEMNVSNQMEMTGQHDLYQFSPLSGDLFQPEEIFQLDQPLKPPGGLNNSTSPPTLLDLGSGTIQQQKGIFPDEESTNNSSSSRNNESSPHHYEATVFGQSHFHNNNNQTHAGYFCDASSHNEPQHFVQLESDVRFAKSENFYSMQGYEVANGMETGDGFRMRRRHEDSMARMDLYAQPPVAGSERGLEDNSAYYDISSQYSHASFHTSDYAVANSNNNHIMIPQDASHQPMENNLHFTISLNDHN